MFGEFVAEFLLGLWCVVHPSWIFFVHYLDDKEIIGDSNCLKLS
jgi:hypothetical protein